MYADASRFYLVRMIDMKSLFLFRFCLILLLPVLTDVTVASDSYCHWKATQSGSRISIEEPLCGLTGDADRGREIAIDRGRGNCLACHALPAPEEDFHGQIGPPLYGVALRYSEAELRMRLVDAMQVNPMTIMPGYYRHPDKNHQLAARYEGKTMLSGQQVEDLVAYLLTLKRYP